MLNTLLALAQVVFVMGLLYGVVLALVTRESTRLRPARAATHVSRPERVRGRHPRPHRAASRTLTPR